MSADVEIISLSDKDVIGRAMSLFRRKRNRRCSMLKKNLENVSYKGFLYGQ